MSKPKNNGSTEDRPPPRRWIGAAKLSVRLLILVLVAWGIGRTFSRAEQEFANREFSISDVDFRWILLSGLFYLAGLAPCWVFWHRTLRAMGQDPRWRESLRAFWIGHLGKYVPGKAMVVVLRTGLVFSERVSRTVAATSVFVETLTMMAVGAFLASAILLVRGDNRGLMLLAGGLMLCSGVPTFPPLFRFIVRKLRVDRANTQMNDAIEGVDYRLIGFGWITISIGWVLLGLSLWATLRAMPTVQQAPWESLAAVPLLVATVGLAMVAGFLSLIPGGLGVRDLILMTLLAPYYGERDAIVSAILLRVIWLLSELAISGILYMDVLRARRRQS